MCCLFGFYDYGDVMSASQKNHILAALARSGEVRGTDAGGVAYNGRSGLEIFKRPGPAHRMRLRVPWSVRCVMGHTRMTTQGSWRHNYNNHPFYGRAGSTEFALAHNGVIYNDMKLRRQEKLPVTKIETDSFVAVQLIQQSGELSFKSLRRMAELVDGTFSFSVLDRRDELYLIKGNNPLCLYHWPRLGLYLYASTEEILQDALSKLSLKMGAPEAVEFQPGDILRIDRSGAIVRDYFDAAGLFSCRYPYYFPLDVSADDEYVMELKSVSGAFGFCPEDIDELIHGGMTPEEVEEYMYCVGEL